MCLGIPGKLISIYEANALLMGHVDFGGVIKETCLTYVPDVKIGDYVIIHVGFAISIIDEESALSTYEALRSLDMLAEELEE